MLYQKNTENKSSIQGSAVTFKRTLQKGYLAEMSYRQPFIKIFCLNVVFSCEKMDLAVELM